MPRREKASAPIVRKHGEMLAPVSQFDADEISRHANGTEFDLVSRTKRSPPQQRTYWDALGRVVEATERWPTKEALHTALKASCGLVEPFYDLKGNVCGMQAHSTAFEKMTHREFTDFFSMAMAKLAEAVGFDPLEWMNR
jgi:hypothetical protein